MVEYQELSAESQYEQQKHLETLRQYETRIKARSMAVPTIIDEVKNMLRYLGHPATYFGEGHYDRRERLKECLAALNQEDYQKFQDYYDLKFSAHKIQTTKPSTSFKKEIEYSEASEDLIKCREILAEKSFQLSEERINHLNNFDYNSLAYQNLLQQSYQNYKKYSLNFSQNYDTRPLSCIKYSSSSPYINNLIGTKNILAVGGFSSSIKLINPSNLEVITNLRGHADRISSLSWAPSSSFSDNILLGSTSTDGAIVWNLNKILKEEGDDDDKMNLEQNPPEKLLKLPTSDGEIFTSSLFHSTNSNYFFTSSNNHSFSLFDLEYQKKILLQDGHNSSVQKLSINSDGNLLLTGDASGNIFLWDVRNGKRILYFQSHLDKIVSLDFNLNSFQFLSSSLDNNIKFYDIRNKKNYYTLPCHTNTISHVQYFNGNMKKFLENNEESSFTDSSFSHYDEFIITSSYDSTIKIWNSRNFEIVKTLHGHIGKVFCVDCDEDGEQIASIGYDDKTVKIWGNAEDLY